MANFNTHISFAVGASCFATVVCTSYFSLGVIDACILFVLGAGAGLLPDIDSDHSIPIRWMFRLLTLAIMLLIVSVSKSLPPLYLLAYLCAAAFVIYYLVLPIFKRITVHRGLFHSIPAALLFGLAMLWLGQYVLMWPLSFSWLAAAFISAGYLLHLLLDEAFSVDLLGGRLKGSFGSALTLFSFTSWPSYCLLYLMVVTGFLLLPMPDILERVGHNFLAKINILDP